MAFLKEIELPNGIAGRYHKIVSITTKANLSSLEVQVGSWPTEESFLSGISAIWNYYVEIPIGSLVETSQHRVLMEEPFIGAQVLENPTDLAGEKYKKWTDIKWHRNRAEYGGFQWDGSAFDSDPVSQSRIQGGVQLAQMAMQNNQPFSITWTLLDNTTRALDAAQMVGVGVALAQHVQSVHNRGRELKAQIDSATTAEQVQQITWS